MNFTATIRDPPPPPSPPPQHTHTHSPAGALQPPRRRARRWAATVGHGPCAAGAGGAARRGAQDRSVPLRADPRCSCAADGGTGWWRCSRPLISLCPSRLSKRPRSQSHPVVVAFLIFALCPWSTRRGSSWWKCRLSCLSPLCSGLPSRALTFQVQVGVREVAEVFKVCTQDTVLQRWWASRSLTFQFRVVGQGWAVFSRTEFNSDCVAADSSS